MKQRSAFQKLMPTGAARWGGAELALAVLVVAIVAMMIVPLPTWLIDVLISTNLAVAVTILLVVLFVPDALAIATFPTLLLLTTLFRLALSVSSTRLILLQANAGDVIKAFGTFVVRGNYVVGGIVFLILTLIQFLVIAKGSERVAEVGARFVLDAMPGKQMAIDAELRGGTLDGLEARRRRRALSRESQFFGAMDGAMKFVKGDVIASVIIAVINILGGLAIGVGQRHMAAADALKRYGLLTIGDGLVTQIPALVLTTAAGILVTRTASEEPDTPLGEELGRQLLGIPKALQISAGFLVMLALVPGLPAAPFLFLAAALGTAAHFRTKTLEKNRRAVESTVQPTAGTGKSGGPAYVPRVIPWSVDVSEDLTARIDDVGGLPGIRTKVLALREQLFSDLGVPLLMPRIRVDVSLPPRHAVVCIHEVPAHVLSIAEGDLDAAPDLIAHETYGVLRLRVADFVGFAETQKLVDELEQFAPAVVRNVVPKPLSIPLLTEVLRRLVEEGISIRDLRLILESLAAPAQSVKDPLALSEVVRGKSSRATTHNLTRGASFLNVLTLDPQIEHLVAGAIRVMADGQFLELAPAQHRDIQLSVRRALSQCSDTSGWNDGRPAVIFTPDSRIRRHVRKILGPKEFPNAVVLSPLDLLPDIQLRSVAKATLEGLAA